MIDRSGSLRAPRAPWGLPILLAVLALATHARADNYTEGADLSNDKLNPTPINLTLGINSVIGSVGDADFQDWFALTVPVGFTLSAVIPTGYQAPSGDEQAFTGFQLGTTFPDNEFSADSYAGFAHFGPGAQNGFDPPANNIGDDILPVMNNPAGGGLAEDADGFTNPLPAGTYTFLIQQLGGETFYKMEYTVSAVPEPSTIVLMGLGFAVLVLSPRAARRRARR